MGVMRPGRQVEAEWGLSLPIWPGPFFLGGPLLSVTALLELLVPTWAVCGLWCTFKICFSVFWEHAAHAFLLFLVFLPLGPGPQGLQKSLPTGAHIFSLLPGPSSGNRAPFPPGTSEPSSQASHSSLHQRIFRKSRAHRGCGWYGLPPAQHIYGYVGVTGNACSCAGWEGAAQHPHKIHAVTSPRLVLLGPISANTHASTCPALHQYLYLESGEES